MNADPDRYRGESATADAMQDACLLEFGLKSQQEQVRKLTTEAQNRRRSQPSRKTANKTPPKKLSQDEAEDKVLEAIERGESREQVRKIAASLGIG